MRAAALTNGSIVNYNPALNKLETVVEASNRSARTSINNNINVGQNLDAYRLAARTPGTSAFDAVVHGRMDTREATYQAMQAWKASNPTSKAAQDDAAKAYRQLELTPGTPEFDAAVGNGLTKREATGKATKKWIADNPDSDLAKEEKARSDN
jgi:hypothetical protein